MSEMSDPGPEGNPDPVEKARADIKRRARRRYSHHLCPKCGSEALQRKHLPRHIRPLRLIPGMRPRAYRCDQCGAVTILWRTERDSPD